MEDAGIFAKQLAEKVEEARIALGKKDETHAAEITSKDSELKSKEESHAAVEEELAVKYKIGQKEATVKYRELGDKFQEMSLSKVVVIVFFIWYERL